MELNKIKLFAISKIDGKKYEVTKIDLKNKSMSIVDYYKGKPFNIQYSSKGENSNLVIDNFQDLEIVEK